MPTCLPTEEAAPGVRVLTFLHSFEPGGVERVALRLVRAWREMGMDAPLFMGRADGAMRVELGEGLAYHAPRQPLFGTAAFETLWMIATLPFHVRKVRPDVLFCAGNSYTIVAAAMKLLLGRHCPPVIAKVSNCLDRRDMAWFARPFYRAWLRIQGRMIDRLIGMEAPMRDEIMQAMHVSGDKVAIIPDPALSQTQIMVMRATPRIPPAEKGERRFVAIGRLARQKDFPMMLRAFARGAGPLDRLTIIGEGPVRGELEALAIRLGLEDQVILAGHLPDPTACLAGHDILLLSSTYEGVPAVILEALAAGLPIIATDCSASMRTLLQQGHLGALVPVGDEAALAAAINIAQPGAQDAEASLVQAMRFTLESAAGAYAARFEGMVDQSMMSPAPPFVEVAA